MTDHPDVSGLVAHVESITSTHAGCPCKAHDTVDVLRRRQFVHGRSNGSWVAEIVQIADTPAGLRVEKIWISADVG